MKRICSSEDVLQDRLKQLEEWLTNRGYKQEKVRAEIDRVNNRDRSDLLGKKQKTFDNRLTLVLTYHPALNQVHQIVQRLQRHVTRSPTLNAALPEPPRIAFRNAKTLRNLLVRSKLKVNQPKDPGTHKCGHSLCEICPELVLGNQFTSTNTGKSYTINFHLNCNSFNVIYLLTCKVCNMQYVGSTTTKFRLRYNQYKSQINLYGEGRRDMKQKKFVEHFYSENHHGTYKDISVQLIDHCDPNDQERREDFWIYHFDTMFPKGLNQKEAQ